MDCFDQLNNAEKDQKKDDSVNKSTPAVPRSPKIPNLKVRVERNRSIDMADGREMRKRSIDSQGNSPEAKHPRREQVSKEAPQPVNVSPSKRVARQATNASPVAPKMRSCYVRLSKMKTSLLQTSPSRSNRKKRKDTPEPSPPTHKEIDLKRRYGKRWFRCHVRIQRCRQSDANASVKSKATSKNLSVSFSDEVEICGKKVADSESGVIHFSMGSTMSSETNSELATSKESPCSFLSSSDSFSPSKNTSSPKIDIGTPERDIDTTLKDNGTPKKNIGTPKKDIGTPKKDIGTPKKDTGTPKKDIGTPKKNIGTPKKDIATPKQEIGTSKKDIGTSKKDTGTPKKDIGTSKKDTGTPEKVVRSPKMHIGTPKKDIGTSKTTITVDVTSDTVDSSSAQEEEPFEPNVEMNGLIALKAYEEDEDDKEDDSEVNEERQDKVDITTVAEIHQNPGDDDDKAAEAAILNGAGNNEDAIEKKEEPSLVANAATTEATNCEDIASGDELAPQAEESKEPSFQEALPDDPTLPVTFDDNSSGSFASAEGLAHLNDDDSVIEKIRSFIDEKSNTEDNRIHDNEAPDLSMLTGEHQYSALTAKSRPALHTFENRFNVLEDGGDAEQGNEAIRLCVEESSNISEDVAVLESTLNPPAVLLEEDDCRNSTIETMVVEQPDDKAGEQEPMLVSD